MTHYAINASVITDAPSGARRRFAGLARAIARQLESDEHITILHGPDLTPFEIAGDAATCAWRRVEIPATPTWRRVWAERKLGPILTQLEADLVDIGALPVPPHLPCPAVLTIHDLRDLDGEARRLRPPLLVRRTLRRAVARAACVIVPSQFTADRLRAQLQDVPAIRVAPGGIELDELRQPEENATPPFILHVGHLEPRKQLELLIDAFARLPRRHSNALLRLVGADHGCGAELRARARNLAVADRIRFEGVVDDTTLANLYATAAVIAVPSRYEGFGLAALEGLAAGKPVVVSDRGALPEVVGSAGVIVRANDSNETWHDALGTALDEPPLAHTSPAFANKVETRHARARTFAWETTAQTVLGAWREHANRILGSTGAADRADCVPSHEWRDTSSA